MLRPPQHRVDAPIVFVHPSDPAWDKERVDKEMTELGDRAQYHPVVRYLGGWTRYNIDAPGTLADGSVTTAREYLDESKQPTVFKLRRLTFDEWYEVEPLVEKARRSLESPFAGYIKACRFGLESIENGPALEMPGRRCSHADMTKLYATRQDLPYDIGEAVYQASMPLTESEGKL